MTIKTTVFPKSNIKSRRRTVKKRELILEDQQFWETLEKKKITTVAEYFKISNPAAKRYIYMSTSEIEGMEILKYLLTCNPKVQKDKELGKYIDLIKEKIPIVSRVENVFKEFHAILMGDVPEKMDEFLEKYSDGELASNK